MVKIKEGWGTVNGARKWHYYNTEGYSLCNSWFRFNRNDLFPDTGNDPNDCKTCRKKLDAINPH